VTAGITSEDLSEPRAGSGAASLLRLCLLAGAVTVLTAAAALGMRAAGDNAFIVLAIASGGVAMAATRVAEGVPTARALWLVIGIALLLRGTLIFLDPLLSGDIYRYVWDGKVQAAGINPYRHYPADDALASLRDETVYPKINRVDWAVTIYPPVAQMFFFLVTRFGENVTTMKIAMVACDGVIAAIILLFLRRLGKPLTRLVAYAWHPLPMWEIANSGHIDALMMMLMMVGLWLALSGRPLRGAMAISLGALAKPFAVLALPAAWRPWDWKVPLVILAVIILCYLPYLSIGSGVLGFLTTGYLQEEGIESGSTFWLLSIAREIVGTVRGDTAVYIVLSALIVATLAMVVAHRAEQSIERRLADINTLLLVTLFLLSPNYPWYFLMVTPFVALRGGMPNWALTMGAILLQEEVSWDPYVPLLVRETIFYGLFLAACGYVLWHRNRRARADVRE
jgi:alpha-1,6-mannosyltransferase